jgi:hypothetical protein
VETLAFFLCSLGMAVASSSAPGALYRQVVFLVMGLGLYFAVGWFLRDLDRAKKLRWPIAGAGLALLAVNVALGGTVFGAKNWLEIGGVSFQPSEFVKIAFVFAGAATLDRLFARRNLLLFVAFAGACLLALAAMSDFGTALVFFVAYLVIAFLRSGDFATVILSVAGAGFAGFKHRGQFLDQEEPAFNVIVYGGVNVSRGKLLGGAAERRGGAYQNRLIDVLKPVFRGQRQGPGGDGAAGIPDQGDEGASQRLKLGPYAVPRRFGKLLRNKGGGVLLHPLSRLGRYGRRKRRFNSCDLYSPGHGFSVHGPGL